MLATAPRRGRGASAPPEALRWVGGAGGRLEVLDQTRLPGTLRVLRVRGVETLWRAIRRLSVRGAPALGVAAAYGVYLGVRAARGVSPSVLLEAGRAAARRLASSRPTAVNLFIALSRMTARLETLAAMEGSASAASRARILRALLAEARAIHEEDRRLCADIGRLGMDLLPPRAAVLTHCNAGALATGGMGTALALIYAARAAGKSVRVIADETRPLLQGARLTAWELGRAGVPVTVICDGAAGSVLREGQVDCVVVGADRIARNGDVANKIGTYGLAVLARAHRVPFYVAAPSTTFDLSLASGKAIPIEERSEEEVRRPMGRLAAPPQARARNPAFDVTPARLITAIVTERGVLRPPYARSIRAAIGPAARARTGRPGGGTPGRRARRR